MAHTLRSLSWLLNARRHKTSAGAVILSEAKDLFLLTGGELSEKDPFHLTSF
jgi:hypothetical protein